MRDITIRHAEKIQIKIFSYEVIAHKELIKL
jgi:hypothetical protein